MTLFVWPPTPTSVMQHTVYSIDQLLTGYCLATQSFSVSGFNPLTTTCTNRSVTHAHHSTFAPFFFWCVIIIMTVINQRLSVSLSWGVLGWLVLRGGGVSTWSASQCFAVSVMTPAGDRAKSAVWSVSHSSRLAVAWNNGTAVPVHLSASNTPAVDKSIREDEQGKEEEEEGEETKGLQLVYFANKEAPNGIFFFHGRSLYTIMESSMSWSADNQSGSSVGTSHWIVCCTLLMLTVTCNCKRHCSSFTLCYFVFLIWPGSHLDSVGDSWLACWLGGMMDDKLRKGSCSLRCWSFNPHTQCSSGVPWLFLPAREELDFGACHNICCRMIPQGCWCKAGVFICATSKRIPVEGDSSIRQGSLLRVCVYVHGKRAVWYLFVFLCMTLSGTQGWLIRVRAGRLNAAIPASV